MEVKFYLGGKCSVRFIQLSPLECRLYRGISVRIWPDCMSHIWEFERRERSFRSSTCNERKGQNITAYSKRVFPLHSMRFDRFSLLNPIGLYRICQTLKFFIIGENKIETCGKIQIKLGDAVLFCTCARGLLNY